MVSIKTKNRKRMLAVVTCVLSLLIVIGVFWSLRLAGITRPPNQPAEK